LQWGSIAEVASSLGTIGALVAAIFAARAAVRATRQQDKQLIRLEVANRMRADEAKRKQAESVGAWIALDKETTGRIPSPAGE
jgi:hypothetical protein